MIHRDGNAKRPSASRAVPEREAGAATTPSSFLLRPPLPARRGFSAFAAYAPRPLPYVALSPGSRFALAAADASR